MLGKYICLSAKMLFLPFLHQLLTTMYFVPYLHQDLCFNNVKISHIRWKNHQIFCKLQRYIQMFFQHRYYRVLNTLLQFSFYHNHSKMILMISCHNSLSIGPESSETRDFLTILMGIEQELWHKISKNSDSQHSLKIQTKELLKQCYI